MVGRKGREMVRGGVKREGGRRGERKEREKMIGRRGKGGENMRVTEVGSKKFLYLYSWLWAFECEKTLREALFTAIFTYISSDYFQCIIWAESDCKKSPKTCKANDFYSFSNLNRIEAKD